MRDRHEEGPADSGVPPGTKPKVGSSLKAFVKEES